ncbi:hypothetical protein Scep_024314 [Stephania cephalantha]|uniref:Uncharacterized protein n=1 Tax=Stephania cephalantha TaxID=152367 RepID=A0AAP0F589_9MAGN
MAVETPRHLHLDRFGLHGRTLHGHHGRHFDHPTINNVNGLPPPRFSRSSLSLLLLPPLLLLLSVSPPPLMSVRCEKERCGRVYVREKVR